MAKYYGLTALITVQGNAEYKDEKPFCCCYYKNLAGCNLLLEIATKGFADRKFRNNILPTEYGASVRSRKTGGLRLSDSSSATNAEELTHAAYGVSEFAAKRAKDLVTQTGGVGPYHQTGTPVDELDKVLIDLVSDKFNCRSILDDSVQANQARHAAQQFLDRASRMYNNTTSHQRSPEERPKLPDPYWPPK
jgi:hypothetical protein